VSILYHFSDTTHYLSKFADFTPPLLHLAPALGVTPFEFRKDFWHQKTRFPGLSCDIVCVFLCLAIVVEHRLVADTHTHTHTHRQTHGYGIYRESYSSRGKNTTNVEIKYRKDLPHNLSRMVKVKHKRPNILILILFFSTAGFLAINEITSIHQQKISLCKHSLGEDTISYRLQFYGSVRHIYAAACQLGNIMHSF